MTSAQFATVPLDSIIIDSNNRQRKELPDISELAESISDVGLIHPPVLTRDNILVAGERRITAMRSLGWTSTVVQYTDELDPDMLYLIELEENVKRVNLTWRDHNNAICEYHNLRKSMNPEWTQANSATALGVADETVRGHLTVGAAILAGNTLVIDAPRFSTALGAAARHKERKTATVLEEITQLAAPTSAPAETKDDPELPFGDVTVDELPELISTATIETGSFLEWSKTPLDTPYNFLHCDFPYGVNAGDKTGYSAAKELGKYDDTLDTYLELLSVFSNRQDNFIAPSAHMMFWFAMDYYEYTKDALEKAGWVVNPYPLIWFKTDNRGILPDPQRGGRRVYETAFHCTRGDRKVAQPIANCFGAPTTKNYHQAEKPYAVLNHFFRMYVDDTTRFLDPTCGGGMAVRVARDRDAADCLGIELDPDYADRARENLTDN